VFNTLKLYKNKELSLATAERALCDLGYLRAEQAAVEGDFSVRGDTLEVFPINFNFPLRLEWRYNTIEKIYSYDKALRRKIIDYDFLIIIPHRKILKKYDSEDIPLETVLRLEPGDFVVHARHGIGRFLGMKELKVRERLQYFFEIEYDRTERLYVSKEEAHLIQKYASFGGRPPRLNRLGSGDWTRTKARVQKGIKYYALQLLRMQAQRQLIGGIKFSPDTDWQKDFEQGFPYQETEDQLKAINDVKADMESARSMDRIVCGDVGYGKTEVAMRAAFKAVMDGVQVAFLVPTTILAYQHYLNFLGRLEKFPLRVAMLSRFLSTSERRQVIDDLALGIVDIVIGTHRLLSQDVIFKKLGFLVVDEEHKFGVTHKEKIKTMKAGIDVLTLTATPIPRTLYMGLAGVKNISLIKTPPKERLAVQTKTIEFSLPILREIITREIQRKGEVFVINNRIETIFKLAAQLKRTLPAQVKMAVIHGRMPAHEIEQAMRDFVDKKINCLVSTAIVESGIDIPSANTIIINDAHLFGLADLHQLRGRVGRFNLQAYAYLVIPSKDAISGDARKKLELIEEFSHLGAGFEVAMKDLELRGAGSILGAEQSGFIWQIGFDMYCRLLKKEVEYLKEAFRIDRRPETGDQRPESTERT